MSREHVEFEILQSQAIQTMRAGRDEPKSVSDWQMCFRALYRMFEVTRRPLSVGIPTPTQNEGAE
jgi:hypothetical protein